MRRLVAFNLLFALLAPWMAVVAGAALSTVPCPMHHAGMAEHSTNATAIQVREHGHANHDTPLHHTSARGCNCAGECGRTGAAFSLAVRAADASFAIETMPALVVSTNARASIVDRLLPLPTGPPKSLRS